MFNDNTITLNVDDQYFKTILQLCVGKIPANRIIVTRTQKSLDELKQKSLIHALKQTKISRLIMQGSGMVNNDFAKLLAASECSLSIFHASNQMFTDDGFKILFDSQIFGSNIKFLKIDHNHLKKGHLIFELLFKSSIMHVNIANNQLSMSGNSINVDDNVLLNCDIEFMDISGNCFKNEGFTEVMLKLSKLPKLQELYVCDLTKSQSVSSEVFVRELSRLKQVEKINISHNVISTKDLEWLENQLPNVTIIKDYIIPPKDYGFDTKSRCSIQ